MDEEMRFHVEMETEKNIRAGLELVEARRQALIAFGGVERHKEVMRAERGARWLSELIRDHRFAVRSLARRPGFTLVAALTIAVGVGATTAVFGVTNAVLLRQLAVPAADRLFAVTEARGGAFQQSELGIHVPYVRYLAYEEATADVFSGLAAQRLETFALKSRGGAVPVEGALTSGNYFSVLGVAPAVGRFFLADREPAVVLAHHVWRQRFGGGADVVGSTVHLNSKPFTVVGVAPRGFGGTTFGVSADVWVPIAAARGRDELDVPWVALFGRLHSGVDARQASALVDAVAKRVPPDEPQTRVHGAEIEPMSGFARGGARGRARREFGMLLGMALMVLLIASGNVAGMLLARGVTRRRELAIRQALGAGRMTLVRQLLTESGLLALVGGAGGLLLALLGVRVAPAAFPTASWMVPPDLGLDLRVFAFALGLTVATAILFGLVPSLQASAPALVRALKDGGSTGATRSVRWRDLFVGAQLAMAVFLLAVAGLFGHSLQRMLAVDLGYEVEGVVIATTDLDPHGYDEARVRAFYGQLVDRLRANPGIDRVSLAHSTLAEGPRYASDMAAVGGRVERAEPGVTQNRVDPAFFTAVGLPIVVGRGFTEQDRAGTRAVTVVNETLARQLWPNENALGKLVETGGEEHEVIGIVPDGRYSFRGAYPSPSGYAFMPLARGYTETMTVHVRGRLQSAELISRIREEVRAIDPNIAVDEAQPLSQAVGKMVAKQRVATLLLTAFGIVGVILAGIGVYGLLSFQVAQRRRELGVRVALGARGRAVIGLVVRRGMLLTGLGLVLGLLLSAWASFALRHVLFGVSAFDPIAFAGVSLILTAVAFLATFVPVRRATRVDPIEVLRTE